MIKLISLIIAGALTLTGCSSDGSTNNTEDTQVKTESKQEEPKEMNKVLVDDEYCTITMTGYYEDTTWSEAGFKVTIVNKSDKNLLIGVENVSVDGTMEDPFWATTVAAGKESNEKIYWYTNSEDNNIKSVDDLKNIEMTFNISDDDSWDRYGEYKVNIE